MMVPKARRLKSGKFFIQLRVGGTSTTITAPTERECVRKATLAKAELLNGKRPKSPHTLTLGDAIDRYISRRDAVLSPSTVRGYAIVRRTRFQAYTDRPIDSIDWQKMVNDEARLCSPKTLKNAWGLVSSAVADATGSRPTATLPKDQPKEHPFFSPDQTIKFVKAIHGKPVEIPALLALHSLRLSELLALTWQNVDLSKGIIRVRGAVVRSESGLVAKPQNKNATSARDVPILIPELSEALKKARQKTGQVVTMSAGSISRAVNNICRAEGLPEVGVHGLRHSFVSLAYSLGIPEKAVMAVGGWSDYQTMRKIYTHLSQSDTYKMLDAMRDFYTKNAN